MPIAHAELGASSAHRWMNCPGSVRLSRGLPNKSTFAARYGTVAHTLGELALLCSPEDRMDFLEEQLGRAVDKDHPDIPVDRDMIIAVRMYVNYCGQLMPRSQHCQTELRVALKGYGHGKAGKVAADMFGTADFVSVRWDDRTLEIVDYKHGSGVTVEPADNPQLKYYAAGVLADLMQNKPDLADRVDTVITTVVQPRDDHLMPIRHYGYDKYAVINWVEEKLLPAAVRTTDPDAPLNPGEWCRFCPAQGVCPARREKQLERAKMLFEPQGELIVPEKPADKLTIDELRVVLDSAEDIIAWVKACQKLAHEMLEQNTLTDEEETQLGYKLVKKRAMRKFKGTDEEVADALCEEFGLGDDELFTKKLRSPAQIEKEIGSAAVKKSGVWSDLIVSESSGTTLARDDDTRPKVKRKQARDVFAPAGDGEDEDEGLL